MNETPATSSGHHAEIGPDSPGERPPSHAPGQRSERPACADKDERADERREESPEARNLATDDEESWGQKDLPAGLSRTDEESGDFASLIVFAIMLWWFRRQFNPH